MRNMIRYSMAFALMLSIGCSMEIDINSIKFDPPKTLGEYKVGHLRPFATAVCHNVVNSPRLHIFGTEKYSAVYLETRTEITAILNEPKKGEKIFWRHKTLMEDINWREITPEETDQRLGAMKNGILACVERIKKGR